MKGPEGRRWFHGGHLARKEDRMEKYLENYPPVLTVSQVAEILNVNKNTVFRLIKAGEIPAMRVGRLIRIPKDRMIEYLNGAA